MAEKYFNYPRNQVANQKTGYTNKAWLAPKEWFTLIAEPIPPYANPEDAVIITADHTFPLLPTPKGFIQVYCLPHTVEGDGEASGDAGAGQMNWKPKIFIPGDSPKLQTMVEQMINDDLILLVQDANCPTSEILQFGCDCNPASRSESKFTSGTTQTSGRKGYEITLQSNCRFWYRGTITTLP